MSIRDKLLSELKSDTLRSYIKKRQQDPAFEVKKGKVPAVKKARREKLNAHMATALNKIQDNSKREIATETAKIAQAHKDIQDDLVNYARETLPKMGWQKVHEVGKRSSYVKKHDNGHLSTVSLYHSPHNGTSDYRDRSEDRTHFSFGSSKGSGHSSFDVDTHLPYTVRGVNDLDAVSKTRDKFDRHLKDFHDHAESDRGW